MPSFLKYLLWVLMIVWTAHGVSENPMLLIFPMWLVTYLLRQPLKRMVRHVPLSVSFIGFGIFFGLVTESLAIINNLSLPPEQRILLSPDPMLDLAYGLFYYTLLIVTWYVLIKAFTYSQTEVFIITGIYGILTEEVGQVFLRIFTVGVYGLLYAIIIAFVYGIFPMLAYMLSEEQLGPKRAGLVARFLVAAVALFGEWALYGLFILPRLKQLFEQSGRL